MEKVVKLTWHLSSPDKTNFDGLLLIEFEFTKKIFLPHQNIKSFSLKKKKKS